MSSKAGDGSVRNEKVKKTAKKKKVKVGQPPAADPPAAVREDAAVDEGQTVGISSRKEKKRRRKDRDPASAVAAAEHQASPETAKPTNTGKQRTAAGPEGDAGSKRAPASMAAKGMAMQAEDKTVPAAAAQRQKKRKKRKREDSEAAAVEEPVTAAHAPQGDVPSTERKNKTKKKRQKAGDCSSLQQPVADGQESAITAIEAGGAATTAVNAGDSGVNVERAPESTGKLPANGDSSGKRPFQRVNAEEWLDKKGAWSNSYEANFGNQGWGAGAQATLGQVRGKDFRHEKTKKKRGTYRGGQIDHSVNSFKFESDDE